MKDPEAARERPAAAARPRRRAGDRRLRHRLLVAGLPPAPAGGLPQGRPVLRRRDGRRARRDRLGGHRPGRHPQPLHRRRGGRDRSSRPRSSPASAPPTCRASACAEPMTGGHAAAWFAAHAEDTPMTVVPRCPELRGRPRARARRCSTSSRCWRASTRWPPSGRSPRRSSRSPTPTTPARKALSRILASDVALASRVMKLANSAYFGMRGRVTSLQFAVTVVGFTTVRTMATVALTNLDDESRLPENFWDVTTSLALAASTLAPRFGERPPGRAVHGPARADGRRAAAPQRPGRVRGDRRRAADVPRPARAPRRGATASTACG